MSKWWKTLLGKSAPAQSSPVADPYQQVRDQVVRPAPQVRVRLKPLPPRVGCNCGGKVGR